MKRYLFLCLLVPVVSAFLMACPPPGGWPKPPFNAIGKYVGDWEGRTTADAERQQVIAACPLSMILTQDLTKPYPGDHGVQGNVTVDYSCLELPEWVAEQPPSVVNVSGILGDDGKLTLLSGGCAPGVCVVLTLAGQGEDTDEDGFMDTYSGTWSYLILLAGVQPFGVSGTYEVTRLNDSSTDQK